MVVNDAPLPDDVAAHYREAGAEAIAAARSEWSGPAGLVARPLLAVTPEGTVRHDVARLAAVLAEFLAAG